MRAIDYFDKGAEAFPGRIAILDRTAAIFVSASAAGQPSHCASHVGGADCAAKSAWRSTPTTMPASCSACWDIMRAGARLGPHQLTATPLDANVEFLNYSQTSWLFYHSSFHEQVEEIANASSLVAPFRFASTPRTDGDPSLGDFMRTGEAQRMISTGPTHTAIWIGWWAWFPPAARLAPQRE